MSLGSSPGTTGPTVVARAATVAREVAGRAYRRLARLNYERELVARENRTPAGRFRCYEPLPRHGDDELLAELDAACGPTAVVYDVGANVGIYALALATDAPDRRLVAFEPAPAVADQLRANVRLNGLENRIELFARGLADETGTRPFYRSSNPELSAFDRESATRWGAVVRDVRSVPVARLDDLAVDASLPAPDAIKIDVEGAAPAVLRGGRETLVEHRPTLFIEIHEDGLTADVPGETKGVLSGLGYEIRPRTGYWRCNPR